MRLFTAIALPKEIKEEILKRSMEFSAPGVTLVKEEALHLTLHFFGEKSEDEEKKIIDSLSKVRWNRFQITLQGISTFNPKFIRVIFVGLKEEGNVVSLYNSLSKALDEQKIDYEREEYKPHITIARMRFGDREKALSLIEKYKDYNFGSFEVSSFFLIKSTLARDGPIYENLHEFKP